MSRPRAFVLTVVVRRRCLQNGVIAIPMKQKHRGSIDCYHGCNLVTPINS